MFVHNKTFLQNEKYEKESGRFMFKAFLSIFMHI